ncbi:hypothetical protein Clacol_001219 [Clathrus columnatus]|uniref:Uncharacterized protein n=1 Tax=Clathrus columnatus TaxID=1419009 RepID=A0AAV4ZXV0_9AGAM|nr:hypothetical protein Clacol_001219 [Clathrus columnatus]
MSKKSILLDRMTPITDYPNTRVASLYHTTPISSITANNDGTFLFTASWNAIIGVWNTGVSDVNQVPLEDVGEERKNTRKVANEEEPPVRKRPEEAMKPHTIRVPRALFSPSSLSNNLDYNCGLDSTVQTWDASAGLRTSTMTPPQKPVHGHCCTSRRKRAASTGYTAFVLIYELVTQAQHQYRVLPTLVAHPTDERRFMSGSYDRIIRI